MTGKPVFAESEREKVLFPDPAIPVTRTRRPISKAASLIEVSVPQVLYQAHQLAASNGLRRPVVGTNRGTKPWGARELVYVPLITAAFAQAPQPDQRHRATIRRPTRAGHASRAVLTR
jgi:hypothetical protein